MPMLKVPEMTVTRSVFGCVCGGTRYPSGSLIRNTKGPSLAGSPSRMAILAPFGSDGGPSRHLISAVGNKEMPSFSVFEDENRSPGVSATTIATAQATYERIAYPP